ncbi:MAG TPA: cardiolipin synthase [Ruminococcus sp.]|nr:cardiolipin synthase [Ruminococcus sp.]
MKNEQSKILRLLPKKRKGLTKFIFSRTLLIVLLIIVQIMVILSFYKWFKQYMPHFEVFQAVFSISMVFYLFSSDMDSSAKLTWMMLITLAPIPATFFLWYTQTDVGQRSLRDRFDYLVDQTREALPQNPDTIRRASESDSCTDDLCHYLNHMGCFPLFENTEVTYFPSGEAKFEVLLEKLKKAEKFIFLEYFIIDEGYMWGSILQILAEKAKLGVEVRVMYDGMCEVTTLSYDYPERMKRFGIQCKAFSPLRPFLSTHYNYRDHRKILVIDGKVGFSGGVNLADEYINYIERFGHWKDTAVMLEGDAVSSLTLLFLQMWNLTETNPIFEPYLALPDEKPEHPSGMVMPYGDCPLDGKRVGESVYMDILNRAEQYVHIMTPYLILDDELQNCLKFAARRGVDVRIILPGIPDKKLAYSLAKTHYKFLTQAGVKIYEYTPGFVHAKVFVSDNVKAVVGTINLDYRSLYHHFECAVYMHHTDCIPSIEEDFMRTLQKCRTVTPESIRNETLFYKVAGKIMKLIAPLM